jgi:hypothetical protein
MHTMGDHAIPGTRCLESARCFRPFELDTDIEAVRCYLYDRELFAFA